MQLFHYFCTMKRWIPFGFALLFLFSCDNEVDLTADYKDIPVVYGLLDATQDTQWIRINKAFLGDGNALLFAQSPDSIYYPNLQVALLRLNSDGDPIDSIALERTENAILKDDGTFAPNPNVLFRYTSAINQNSDYRLHIFNPDNQRHIVVETPIARAPVFDYPNSTNVKLNWEFNATLNPNPVIDFVWLKSNNVTAYQFEFSFEYDEFPQSNTSNRTRKRFVNTYGMFNPFIDQPALNQIRFGISKEDFYTSIVNNIAVDPNLGREFIAIHLRVYGASEELYRYIDINKPSTSIVQKASDYTNIPEGKGIFASRTQVSLNGLRLADNTLDSLRSGRFTNELNFIN